ncbi:hypothetical protein KP803_00145 [Vibrio sp. ZSDE26]|uniref:Porin n=1 Tax=Vibrio amylolyticus TaxID=2847292 RepID=A0A9X1XF95_9VIBR|nr:hypothetical protein [Vibrio amylolyticus]MCK6261676.1 hypothetical protein [Vibrio amylolyticus]
MKKTIIALPTTVATLLSFGVMAHGNVDVSKGSQIEVFTAFEDEANHGKTKTEQSYGFEAIYMNAHGTFVYAEAEAGDHEFYQVGVGHYMNVTDDVGLFVYGSYADGGVGDQEVRARVGTDYQVIGDLTLSARVGYDHGTSSMDKSSYQTGHSHGHAHNTYKSQVGRVDLGFSYELMHMAELSFNYVNQKQFEDGLNNDRDVNRHYEARVSYVETAIQPYVEFRNTTASFIADHYEEQAFQFGVSYAF